MENSKAIEAKKSCKYCHGRGIEGKDVAHDNVDVTCECILRQIRKQKGVK